MAFFTKIAVSIGLVFSSLFGFFTHGQMATTTPQVSVDTQTSVNTGDKIKTGWFSKDSQNAYDAFGNKITGADIATFEGIVVNGVASHYAKDKNHIYTNSGRILKDADPASFQALVIEVPAATIEYAKDKNHVWFAYDLIANADISTFTIAQGNASYEAQDKNNKYWQGQIVQPTSQTSATTTVLDAQGKTSFYFKDKLHVYWDGSDDPNYIPKVVSNYPDSFIALSSHDLYSDGRQVFQWENVLSNDAIHFQLISSSTNKYIIAKDNTYFYMGSNQSAQLTPTVHPEQWLYVELQ